MEFTSKEAQNIVDCMNIVAGKIRVNKDIELAYIIGLLAGQLTADGYKIGVDLTTGKAPSFKLENTVEECQDWLSRMGEVKSTRKITVFLIDKEEPFMDDLVDVCEAYTIAVQ